LIKKNENSTEKEIPIVFLVVLCRFLTFFRFFFSPAGGEDGLLSRQGNNSKKSPSPHTKARIISIAQVVELGFSHVSQMLFRKKRKFSII
jgi:hypothetical protein